MTPDDTLRLGREALARYAWQEAYDALKKADAEVPLGGEGLKLLASAAWWTAHPDETVEVFERSYAAFMAEGDPASAATVSYELARQHAMRGAFPQAMAWMAKAERLAADDPEMPVHGYLAFMKGLMTFFQDDIPGSIAHLDRALELAERSGDRDLHAMTLHDKGHNLVMQGEVSEGLAMIDEAMVSAVGGELGPEAAGYVYCAMISLCSRIGDYTRAAEWTEATTRWCDRHGITGFPGICRVHRAEIMRLRGAWPKAEQEALQACDELPRFNFVSGLGFAFYEIGEIRRRMGDLGGAEEAFQRSHEYGHSPHPGLALVWLANGKVDAAMSGITEAVDETASDRTARLRHLAAQAEISVAAGDVDTAGAAVEELDTIVAGYDSTALRALADAARGVVGLARGDAKAAVADLRAAAQGWQRVDAPFEVAEARLHLARAMLAAGNREAAAMEVKAARTAFERLGAGLGTERAGALLGELADAAGPPERADRAFMFTDIVRSTDLVTAMGDQAWEELLSWHDQKLRSLFAAHRGEVAHHTGDGFFVAFDDPAAAVACAVAVQRALVEHRRDHGFALEVRIGVHAAQATRRGADYSGAEVHKAARIAAVAEGGEILASVGTLETLDGLTVSPPRELALKGIAEPVPVASVEWR